MKLLYVEDNKDNIFFLQELLADYAIEIYPVTDATLALDAIYEQQPHVILMDLHMPQVSGFEIMEHLRVDPIMSDIPVIVLTADATPDTWMESRRAGCHTFLMKPIQPRVLVDTLMHIFAAGV